MIRDIIVDPAKGKFYFVPIDNVLVVVNGLTNISESLKNKSFPMKEVYFKNNSDKLPPEISDNLEDLGSMSVMGFDKLFLGIQLRSKIKDLLYKLADEVRGRGGNLVYINNLNILSEEKSIDSQAFYKKADQNVIDSYIKNKF